MVTLLLMIASIIVLIIIAPNYTTLSNAIFWSTFTILIFVIIIPPIVNTNNLIWGLINDNISTPLLYLSAWLIPVSIIANTSQINNESNTDNKTFSIIVFTILFFLVITFTSNNIIALFLGFEGTLLPTLFLVSRWGAQQERIEAGYFFVFYTLISSLPLFLGLLYLHNNNTTLSITQINIINNPPINTIITITCIVAFLVKVPIFMVHLWLPKAHVEAPVAGSMILAAILLKMGGYGFSRLFFLVYNNFNETISNFIIPFCIWGGLLTSIICLTQTDLKSLIAYSSVSHMSFMVAGLSTLANWALAGGLIIMIAHGVVSSALFSIANTFYERSNTRNLFINRGTKIIFSITPLAWLLFACANMGLPPLPNAYGEVITISTIIANNIINYFPTLVAVISTGIFSLLMFLAINSGNLNNWSNISKSMSERENNVIALHFFPLIFLIISPNLIIPWPI